MNGYARDTQETVISFQNWDNTWHFYSNCPKHIRKWSNLVDTTSTEKNDQGDVVLLNGTITDANVQIVKKRQLTPEQRELAAKRLKEARDAQTK
jgi:hypothetical protein